MTHLFIDDQPGTVDRTVQTWADLLANLDVMFESRGRVLTEVQFDGVGEPTFRDAAVLNRRLSSVQRIDAVSAAPADLLRDCLLEAAGTVSALVTETSAVADIFRGSAAPQGQPRLGGVADQLGQLLMLVQTLQGPLGVITRDADETAESERGEFERLATFVEALIGAQEAADYQTVADVLEYDVAPFLQAWQGRFERLAN